MRSAAAVAIAILFAVAVGCSTDDDTTADNAGADTDGGAGGEGETAEPAAPLTATLQRSTLFETHRSLRLTVTNGGDQDLEIEAVQLSSPLFETAPPQVRDVLVAASDRVAIPLPFGTPQCGDLGDEPPELIAQLAGEDVHVPLEERPDSLLSELRDVECAANAVLASVDLRLGDTWTRTEPRTIEGEIELAQRDSGATAVLEEVRGNVIFRVSAVGAADSALEVSDDTPSASRPIAITAFRCDPHALIEYKRTFILSAYVALNGGERTRVDITAQGGARSALEELLRSCIG
jgi:hypothetical protein